MPPQVTSASNKSLSISFQEIAEHRATYHRPTPEELAAEEEEAAAEAEADPFADPFGFQGDPDAG